MLDVIIINAFHRGDWFIDQIAKTNKKIKVFDWSEKLESRELADCTGPFSVYGQEKLAMNQQEWLEENYGLELQKQGFVVCSEQSTYESQGPFRVEQHNSRPDFFDACFKSLNSKLDVPLSLLKNASGDFNSMDSLKLVKNKNQAVRGVALSEEDQAQVISTKKEKKFILNDQQWTTSFFVVFLNGYEIMQFAQEGLSSLLNGEPIRPKICWQKTKMQIETQVDTTQVPNRFLLIDKDTAPWSEENYLVLEKTVDPQKWNVWFRSWFDMHQQESYFQRVEQKISSLLTKKFIADRVLCAEKPKEVINPLSSSLFPIYDNQDWELQPAWYKDGVFYAGPEKLKDFLWSTQFAFQDLILKSITEEGNKHGG